jgi:hypothetical protein
VHLTRDPIKSVVSMVARNWYEKDEYPTHNKHDWSKYRLNGYLSGVVSQKKWNAWSPLEKCSWYWCYVNKSIEKKLGKLDSKRVFRLKLEDIKDQISELQEFIGLRKETLQIKKSNTVRPHNKIKLETVDIEANRTIIRNFIKTFVTDLKNNNQKIDS